MIRGSCCCRCLLSLLCTRDARAPAYNNFFFSIARAASSRFYRQLDSASFLFLLDVLIGRGGTQTRAHRSAHEPKPERSAGAAADDGVRSRRPRNSTRAVSPIRWNSRIKHAINGPFHFIIIVAGSLVGLCCHRRHRASISLPNSPNQSRFVVDLFASQSLCGAAIYCSEEEGSSKKMFRLRGAKQ